MVSRDEDKIDFDKLEQELNAAVLADEKYWRENDAKFRAVNQKVATYDEFRDIVKASHLKPLDKSDKIKQDSFKQPWNIPATTSKNEEQTSAMKLSAETQSSQSKTPTSASEFTREWRRNCTNHAERYTYLLHIGGAALARILHVEVSSSMLGQMICALDDKYTAADYDTITNVLHVLSSVNRFQLSVDFLSSAEKQACTSLFGKMKYAEDGNQMDVEKFAELCRRYGVDVS